MRVQRLKKKLKVRFYETTPERNVFRVHGGYFGRLPIELGDREVFADRSSAFVIRTLLFRSLCPLIYSLSSPLPSRTLFAGPRFNRRYQSG